MVLHYNDRLCGIVWIVRTSATVMRLGLIRTVRSIEVRKKVEGKLTG